MVSKISVIGLATCLVLCFNGALAVPGAFGPGGFGPGGFGPGGFGPGGFGPGGAGGAGGVNPWIPTWVASAPWIPQWSPCTVVGPACNDCNSRVVCTKVGGLIKQCSDPLLPHCNLGTCSDTPSVECAPEPAPEDAPLAAEPY